MRPRFSPVELTSSRGRAGRAGIVLHEGKVHPEERESVSGIPVTSVPRTLLDLAEVVDAQRLERAFEEADRLRLLSIDALERACGRAHGCRGLGACLRLIETIEAPIVTASPLEERFAVFCRDHRLPPPAFNTTVAGFEVDAQWTKAQVVVELDGFAFHRHRHAFESDRRRDAALQASGYRVIRLTARRLNAEPDAIAAELRQLLGSD